VNRAKRHRRLKAGQMAPSLTPVGVLDASGSPAKNRLIKCAVYRLAGTFALRCGFRAKVNGIPGEREKRSGVKANKIPG